MHSVSESWLFWAILAAMFAALTAIFAKVGVLGVNSNFATFLRTIVVVLALGLLVWLTGEVQSLSTISAKTGIFLVLSGLATGASWLCYFRALQLGKVSQVAPIDKLSVDYCRGFSEREVINCRMERRRFDRARRGSCGLVLICRERCLGTE